MIGLAENVQAEMCFLGIMILGGISMSLRGATLLSREDFYRPAHQTIFSVLCEMARAGDVIDLVTLRASLGDRMDQVGGHLYLMQLLEVAPTVSNTTVEHYAGIIRDMSLRRHVQTACLDIGQMAGNLDISPTELVSRVQSTALDLGREKRSGLVSSMAAVTGAIGRASQRWDGSSGIYSGVKALDNVLGSLMPGEVTVLSARSSGGKTALAIQYALTAAKAAKRTLFITAEQPADGLALRMILREARINWQRAKHGMTDEEIGRFSQAGRMIASLPMVYLDQKGEELTPANCRAIAMRENLSEPLGLIVVDYLQQLAPDAHTLRASREQQIANASSTMMRLAIQLGVPMLSLAQLNRDGEARESATIFYDATNFLTIQKADNGKPETAIDPSRDPEPELQEIVITKQRDGATGKVMAMFAKHHGIFTDVQDDRYGVGKW